MTKTLTSSNHPLCKLCTHRARGPVPTYHNPAWCYMFSQGEHVMPDGQGWCAQFRQDKEEIKRFTKRITNGRKPSTTHYRGCHSPGSVPNL